MPASLFITVWEFVLIFLSFESISRIQVNESYDQGNGKQHINTSTNPDLSIQQLLHHLFVIVINQLNLLTGLFETVDDAPVVCLKAVYSTFCVY